MSVVSLPRPRQELPVGVCVCVVVYVCVCAVWDGPYRTPTMAPAGGRPLAGWALHRRRVCAPVDYLDNCGCG